MASIRARLDRIKGDPVELIDPEAVGRACREAGHGWRERTLDPLCTLRAFATQIVHGNVAIAHLVRIMAAAGVEFTESAYCQARARLPVTVACAALEAFIARARGGVAPVAPTCRPTVPPTWPGFGGKVGALLRGSFLSRASYPRCRNHFTRTRSSTRAWDSQRTDFVPKRTKSVARRGKSLVIDRTTRTLSGFKEHWA